jgi:drug/metabolite transporter (DMT)-like permease
MSTATLAIVLAAAIIHAIWNMLVAGARDNQATLAVATAVGVVVAAPLAIIRWHVDDAAWPFIIASSIAELIYFWLLTAAYQRAELSLVYPIARGTAPVLVLIVSVGVLGATSSVAQAAGVALVGLGVLLVRGVRRGTAARWSDVGLALAVAVSIASYTLIDKQGVQYADPVTYVVLILIMPALAGLAYVAARGGSKRVGAAVGARSLVGGVFSIAAYGLILFALTQAPAASVAATREVSVVFAAILGAVFLHERVGASRLVGSVVVVVGIALVVAG